MRGRSMIAAFLFASAARAVAAVPPPSCDNPLPQVLDVGLPYSADLLPEEVRTRLELVFAPRYEKRALCPGRPLQVNAALGTDYQLLDWLGSGTVDVAVVSSLTLHLLRRDGVDLLELTDLPETPGGWPASASAELRAVDVAAAGGDPTPRPQPAHDLDRFRESLLERVQARDARSSEKLPQRIVFPSHLSSTGFLVPVADTHRWLESCLERPELEADRNALRGAFWQAFFDHACFHFGLVPGGPSCRELGNGRPATLELEAVAVAARMPRDLATPPRFGFGETLRDHWVIRRKEAEETFETNVGFAEPSGELPEDLAAIFGRQRPEADERAVPAVFSSHLQPQRYFGTRSFAFSIDESLRLLELHQRTSAREGLALVLPGGGVKAAYQSRLVDALYGGRYLANQRVADAAHPAAMLRVRHVIGTSGGALLGYFVAQLGQNGPWNLATILWFRPSTGGAGEPERPLDSADVFGLTDLPRYVSLVLIFIVFSFGLAACSLSPRFWLSPDRDLASRPAVYPTARPALLLPVLAILAGTPLLVSWVSGRLTVEHVPELEGLLYAVLLVVAMFADQCLVERAVSEARRSGSHRWGTWALVAGLALMASAALARFVPIFHDTLDGKVRFGPAYLSLGVAGTLAVVLAVRLRRGAGLRWTHVALGLLGFAASSLAAFALLRVAARRMPRAIEHLDRAPLLFLGLGATLVIVALVRVAQMRDAPPGWYAWIARRGGGLVDAALVRWSATLLAPVFASLLILDLTRPEADVVRAARTSLAMLGEPSKLDLPLGGLAVCLGALLALLGVLWRLAGERGRFVLEGTAQFVDAVLLVVVGLSLGVYVLMGLISWASPDSLTLFELTTEFWLGLAAVSAVGSVALLAWAHPRWGGGAQAPWLRASLVYLCSRHPNAVLLSRRFNRMLLLAVGGLLWWNFLLAPGLYGNRYARKYLNSAEARFAAALHQADSGTVGAAIPLTASLVATANALENDGTHFFRVVPGGEPCPEIRQPAGSGGTWHSYRAQSGPSVPDLERGSCRDLDLGYEADLRQLRAFVFASGSPFPIFPAHWVAPDIDAPKDKKALVDGGYSNNVPIEAAARVGSERVLIVNSSHPLEPDCGGQSWLASLHGQLVDNALRLPGFLFERAQNLDRRSRAGLFVVSLSPPPRCDWPILSDFKGATVRRMVGAAQEDLGRRIGMVESWGPPRFQVSLSVPGPDVAAPAVDD